MKIQFKVVDHGCRECYRRERRLLGLCLKCDRPARRKPDASGERFVHCWEHHPQRKPKKAKPVKKHVLNRETFLKAKKMIAAGVLSMRSIGEMVGASERTVRRVANGEYDSHFKTTAKRNAAAVE